MDPELIAAKVGKSRAHIANTLRLLGLPADVQTEVASGVLTAGHARALLACETEEAMRALRSRILSQGADRSRSRRDRLAHADAACPATVAAQANRRSFDFRRPRPVTSKSGSSACSERPFASKTVAGRAGFRSSSTRMTTSLALLTSCWLRESGRRWLVVGTERRRSAEVARQRP